MLISNFRSNSLKKNGFLKRVFPNIICETLLKPNCRNLHVLSELDSFVKIPCYISKLC